MSGSDQNQQVYEQTHAVAAHANYRLFNAESLAFIHYAGDLLGKRVLDIGCGAGRTSFFLAQLTPDYVGIDYSASMVEACKRRFPDKEFMAGDVRDMQQFADGSFDTVIFSFNGLDSVGHEDRLKALHEIHRILAPNGLFIFSSHNLDCTDKDRNPELAMCMNPRRMYGNIMRYVKQRNNRRSRKPSEVRTDEYAIINDSALDWSLFNYYITLRYQYRQLEAAGFSVARCWDSQGCELEGESASCTTNWIYYAARKA